MGENYKNKEDPKNIILKFPILDLHKLGKKFTWLIKLVIYYMILCFIYFKTLNLIYDYKIDYNIKILFLIHCIIVSVFFASVKKGWIFKILYVAIMTLLPEVIQIFIYLFELITSQNLHIDIYNIIKTNFTAKEYGVFITLYSISAFCIFCSTTDCDKCGIHNHNNRNNGNGDLDDIWDEGE